MDLQLIPTQELVQEIARRFDAFLFCGMRDKYTTDNKEAYDFQHKGNEAVCRGLCDILKDWIVGNLQEEDFPILDE